ncbi:hypothetical protein SAMD00019534_084560 [Acytostelium subglobosum LB1]|uniref:hypothetical protein n=1 Tax=Acytostelium subglobosum LB1 TaxID=1410327 RepID=UPI000644A665|nr:hypothetical protein SAMD00019534_084560 [Acytostelium subglobosum LB1]GAM25281.1 hypothetical protein SAMD00019534_084560 [Acytostelium subglobosum LB1]|eukprot:XP_012751801.1 hypothetical protein SAMD00019534_084560 [Acytostelium subglobosum LB1]
MGQAFGWSTNIADILFTLENEILFQDMFIPGLGLNIVRYNAGASSWVAANGDYMKASPRIKRSRQMDAFWTNWDSSDPESDSWDWSVDANQRNMMLMGRDRGVNHFELFSNSPVWWMCYNHNPSGSDFGYSDNLQKWNLQNHTVYLANIAQHYRDVYGLNFTSVDAFNEPTSKTWFFDGAQEGCHFDVSTQEIVIEYLYDEFLARGMENVAVAASDENNFQSCYDTWRAFSNVTQDFVDKINCHGYEYGHGPRAGIYYEANSTGKVLWMSEYGEGDASGMSMATNMLLDFTELHPTAWVYWQILDIPGWGMIVADDNTNTTSYPVATKYFVFCQFTRHIREGMLMIGSEDPNTMAAYDRVKKDLVIITVNHGTAQWISYDLSNFQYPEGPKMVDRWVTNTESQDNLYQHYRDTTFEYSYFEAFFETNTIQTFVVHNITF